MTGKIYLLQDNGTIQALHQQAYESEDLIQRLLAEHPDLLAGEQIDAAVPRRWLLVSREVGVPGEMDGSDRWSLDHLFLDQDGVPTLVEVKRSSDTRIRREVVAQMLDYAANAVVYWPVETIRAAMEATCQGRGEDPAQLVAELIEAAPDDTAAVDEFWRDVSTNLRAGRIRLVFVADEIPPELKRIVEFLNAQMEQTQVLAVQINQYVGEGLKTLVPRVIGLTAEAEQAKGGGRPAGRQWDEATFFERLASRAKPDEVEAARKILQWATREPLRVWWGRGANSGSFVPTIDHKGREQQLFAVWTYARVEIYFFWYQYKPPFDAESKRVELLSRLNSIPGVSLPADSIVKRPGIRLSVLATPANMEQFLRIFNWVVEEIRSS